MAKKKSNRKSVISSALLLGSVFCLSTTGFAQENQSSVVNDLSQLTLEQLLKVTVVSLFEETELDTNSSVYLIDEDEWRAKGARRTNDIMSYQPGSASYLTLGGSNAFAIRGYSNRLSVRGMATLLDGVPLNSYSFGTAQYLLANFDIGMLSKAELVRGPGSAIYGSDAFHGVFALQTFQSDQDRVDAEIGLGSPGYQRFHTRFSQSLDNSNRLHGGIGLTRQSTSDLPFDDPNGTTPGRRQDRYASESLFLTSQLPIDSQWSSQLGLYYNQWNGDDFPSIGTAALGSQDISDSESEFAMLTAAVTRNLADNKTLEIKSYRWQTQQSFFYTVPGFPFQTQEDLRQGVNIILKQPGGKNRIRWMLGAGVTQQKVLSAQQQSGPQAFDGVNRDINDIFGQVRIPFFDDRLALDLGLRLDDYSNFGAHYSPRLSLIYQPQNDTAIKFLYGNAFRAPVGSEVTSSGVIQGDPNLQPETIDTYELVYLKQTRASSIGLTLFYSQWKDAIIIVDDNSLPAPFTRKYTNQGQFESEGLEAQYQFRTGQWDFDTSISLVESKNKHTYESFVAFPEQLLKFNIGYASPDSTTKTTLTAQGWFNVSESPLATAEKLDSIWLTNLNITHQWSSQVQLSLDIRDVLNQKNAVPSLWGNRGGLPSNGTEVALYLRYQW